MATSSKKIKGGKDADKKTSNKYEDDMTMVDEPSGTVLDEASTIAIEEQVIGEISIPFEPESEAVYDEPILAKLIIERYDGETVRGLFDGYGSAYFVGGHCYEGQFSGGIMNGFGKYTWIDGVIYEGDFNNNHVTGRGKYTWNDGSVYEGEVAEGLRHGTGTFTCPQRSIKYEGEWVKGKQNAKGRLDYDQLGISFYDGQWVNNVRHGHGIRRYPSGNVYEGSWYNNQRHGIGTMQWFDKQQSYSGNWENGLQHGMGQQVWYLRRGATTQYSLRNMYDGQLSLGKRHGFGIFRYANGACYEGEWKHNVKSGKGKFVFKNGRIYEGVFEDDHIAEFPLFEMDGIATPDLSRVRTRTPLPYENSGVLHGNESVNTFSPSFRLDVGHLLGDSLEADHEDEVCQVAFVVIRHMTSLHHIYLFYSRLGHDDNPDNTHVMTRMQFWRFLKDSHLHTENSLVEINRWLARSPKQFDEMHNPFGQLLFREFLDYLVIIAFHLYRQKHSSGPILAGCVSHLITQNVLKLACLVRGAMYCDTKCTADVNVHVDELYGIYHALCTPSKYYPTDNVLTMRFFLFALKDMNLISEKLTAKAFIDILASDDPKVIDCQGGINLELEIVFMEFVEVLIACAQNDSTHINVQQLAEPQPSNSQHSLPGVWSLTNDSDQPSEVSKQSVGVNLENSLGGPDGQSEVESKSFNLSTHQINMFLSHKFLPAARTHLKVLARLEDIRQQKTANAIAYKKCVISS